MVYFRLVCGTLLAVAVSTTVQAVPLHIVNGAFDPDEWTVSATNGAPARPTVTVTSFNVDGPNGAYLFVEQANTPGDPVSAWGPLGNELKLMYDFVNSGRGNPFSTAFDVFFQVPPEHTDYVAHITSFGLQVFQKPTGTVSLVNPDGSLNLHSPPWRPADPNDLALAGFVGVIGFGASPNSGTLHLLAEFELSVSNGVSDGLYSPEPAFWSASTSPREGQCFFPGFPECPPVGPISSAIFTLNSDGTITVVPVLGPNGGPVLQPVPQPTALVLFSTALIGLWLLRRRSATGRTRRAPALRQRSGGDGWDSTCPKRPGP